MLFYMAEYCDTPQSKERRNREHKARLNERAILRLLDRPDTSSLPLRSSDSALTGDNPKTHE